ncbi:MAG: hypothetical protein JXQ96_23185 [Cyclobacteriaceae bacterium]
MMNKIYQFLVLSLVGGVLISCSTGLPDDILGDIPEQLVLPADLEDVKRSIVEISETGLAAGSTIETAINSSNTNAQALGASLSDITDGLEQIKFISRVAPNAVISQEPIASTGATGDVIVYNYSLYTLQGGESTTFVTYQVSQTEDDFVHHIFSGASENPTTLTVHASVSKFNGSTSMTVNLDGSVTVKWSQDSSGGYVFDITEGSDGQVFIANADNSVTLTETSGGIVQSEATWSPAGYGIFNGELVIEGYRNISLWDALTPLNTVANAADDVHKGVMLGGFINFVTEAQPYFDLPTDAVVSTGSVGELAATVMTWTENQSERVYKFYFDESNLYHEVWKDGVLLYLAEESQDAKSLTLSNQVGVPTPDEYWDYQKKVIYEEQDDGSNRYIVEDPWPNSWTGQAMGFFYTITYNPSDISGTLIHQLATKADYWNGGGWGNSYWHTSSWAANGATGSYTHKDVFDWGGATQFDATW